VAEENRALSVGATDYHTAGEPFRIVGGGVGPIPGETVLDKRAWAIENLDRVRRLLVYEPRGHADMYGCFVTEPDDADGDLGVLFFHNAGFSTACGHGTIALATWAIESGVVAPEEPETRMTIDVPSGRLAVVARVEGGRPVSVRFRNVPSFVHSRGLSVGPSSAGEVVLDVAFGGAFYASVDARALGLAVEPANLTRFVELGREIKDHLNATAEISHPLEPRLRDVYGTIFFEGAEDPASPSATSPSSPTARWTARRAGAAPPRASPSSTPTEGWQPGRPSTTPASSGRASRAAWSKRQRLRASPPW
jgi:proline racemase